MEEIEAVLEKICDLHDKLSDEIHMISRSHFLKSVKPATRSEKRKRQGLNSADEKPQEGYVFIKGFPVNDNDAAIQEAKSLNAIRTALEHLEDQLEFFHVSFGFDSIGFSDVREIERFAGRFRIFTLVRL